MKTTYIYALIDPRDDQIRYIGKSNKPNSRFSRHCQSQVDVNTHKRNWINNLMSSGLLPELLIIDEVSIDEWIFWERFYISLFKTYGFNLVNCSSGGEGASFGNSGSFNKGNIPHNKGVKCPQETRNKIKNKLLGTSNVASYRKIIQYDLEYNIIKKYKCVKDAIIESNGLFKAGKISMCCYNKRTNHRGYIWKFDDGTNIEVKKIKILKKSVIQYDMNFNKVDKFNSIKEASCATGIASANICSCCKLKTKSAGGYIWKYLE